MRRGVSSLLGGIIIVAVITQVILAVYTLHESGLRASNRVYGQHFIDLNRLSSPVTVKIWNRSLFLATGIPMRVIGMYLITNESLERLPVMRDREGTLHYLGNSSLIHRIIEGANLTVVFESGKSVIITNDSLFPQGDMTGEVVSPSSITLISIGVGTIYNSLSKIYPDKGPYLSNGVRPKWFFTVLEGVNQSIPIDLLPNTEGIALENYSYSLKTDREATYVSFRGEFSRKRSSAAFFAVPLLYLGGDSYNLSIEIHYRTGGSSIFNYFPALIVCYYVVTSNDILHPVNPYPIYGEGYRVLAPVKRDVIKVLHASSSGEAFADYSGTITLDLAQLPSGSFILMGAEALVVDWFNVSISVKKSG